MILVQAHVRPVPNVRNSLNFYRVFVKIIPIEVPPPFGSCYIGMIVKIIPHMAFILFTKFDENRIHETLFKSVKFLCFCAKRSIFGLVNCYNLVESPPVHLELDFLYQTVPRYNIWYQGIYTQFFYKKLTKILS